MKKNKKRCIIILIILSVLLCTNYIYKSIKNKNDNSNILNVDVKEVNNCNNQECEYLTSRYYYMNANNNIINKSVENFNEKTKKQYKETSNSTLDSDVCINVKDSYSYRYYNRNILFKKETNDYLFITMKYSKIDVCTSKRYNDEIKYYYYDKKNKKELTKDEVLKMMGSSNEDIKIAIEKQLSNLRENNIINISLNEVDVDNVIPFYNESMMGVLFKAYNSKDYYDAYFDIKSN